MQGVTDDDLIRMYAGGDAEAFEALFDRYHVPVYNFARTMLGDAGRPEEILQDVFLAVARSAKGYAPRGRFRPWLMRIARNRCLNRLAAERARRAALAESGLEVAEIASDDLSPSESVADDEQAGMIRAAVAQLPDRQREAICLYAFERMSYREIAAVLEMPVNTVKTLIHRARANLARTLEPFQEPEGEL